MIRETLAFFKGKNKEVVLRRRTLLRWLQAQLRTMRSNRCRPRLMAVPIVWCCATPTAALSIGSRGNRQNGWWQIQRADRYSRPQRLRHGGRQQRDGRRERVMCRVLTLVSVSVAVMPIYRRSSPILVSSVATNVCRLASIDTLPARARHMALSNVALNERDPYVGNCAFAHKGGCISTASARRRILRACES